MIFRREQYNVLKKRIEEPKNKMQVIVGPRQVGKSTLVDQVLQDISIPYTLAKADNVDPQDNAWIHGVWESARGVMSAKAESEHLLIIDEIQKIEQWSEAVKEEWDWDIHNNLNLKVVLLGSSRLLIRKGLKESLSGRFELIRLGHWSLTEMQNAFDMSVDQYIYFGGYPGAVPFLNDEKRWKRYIKDSIVTPAIEKDVIQNSRIYKPAIMKQLFELGCKYSAELLSLNKVVGLLQDSGNVTTAASYIDILNDCQLISGLQKYAQDDARKYASVPKFIVYNTALMSAYHRLSFESCRSDGEQWGRWVESAVGAHLVRQAEELDYEVFYWRERDKEVDFVVVADDVTIAIEVKSGRKHSTVGLSEFAKKFNPTKSFIIGTGGIPVSEFLTLDMEAML